MYLNVEPVVQYHTPIFQDNHNNLLFLVYKHFFYYQKYAERNINYPVLDAITRRN